jgi:prepilin-type N-terminal cleavage/methylation domain-containing protein/prepilin-type processing-associated H-X9-DG protein
MIRQDQVFPREKRRQRAGFTLVELLVVVGIVGLLIALLLPAVQQAREAGRRTTCKNNIRQLSLAIQLYEGGHRHLPLSGIVQYPGYRSGMPFNLQYNSKPYQFVPNSGKMFSWIVQVLPFMEEKALHESIDMQVSILEQPQEPGSRLIASLLCPSDVNSATLFQHPTHTKGKKFAKGNYAAYVSPMHVEFQAVLPGALTSYPSHKSVRITDGMTKTLQLAEVRTRDNALDQRGAWALPWSGASLLALDVHDSDIDNFGRADPLPIGKTFSVSKTYLGQSQTPNNQGPLYDILFDCPDAAGAQLDGMPCGTYAANNYHSAAARSRHTGGVMVAFADTSVRFLVDEVSDELMAYLVSINDGKSGLDYSAAVR